MNLNVCYMQMLVEQLRKNLPQTERRSYRKLQELCISQLYKVLDKKQGLEAGN